MYILGIDTSNYTTSVCLIDENKNIKSLKKLLPVKEGALGLRQSDAVFHHTAQLFSLYEELVCDFDCQQIKAVGVSVKPRPVEGSYMPCFSVGFSTAKVIASTLKVPLFEFSHQEGHIAAAILSSGAEFLFDEKFLAFHVSGGTTEAVIAEPDGFGFKLDLVAKTLDLNAGQAIDRVGVMLGLRFPCGRELDELAQRFDGEVRVKPTLKGCDCCLSGLENLCRKMYDNNSSKENISFFCIKYIEKTLSEMTDRLLEKYGRLPLIYAGGVMSNSIIKADFTDKYKAFFAAPELSSDNAAGVAYLALREYKYDNT